MASTNKTTNYELSQYIGSDKPSYLNDYNQDMSRIDLGIHAAKSEADTNATAIGDLTTLTTTAKTDLVSAINEVDSEASTANATAVQADGKADTNATAIGTLANLDTTAKTNLVSAVNEVNGNVGTLSSLSTTAKTSSVAAINEVDSEIKKLNLTTFTEYTSFTTIAGTINNGKITVAKNSDGSVAKIYGYLTADGNSTDRVSCKISNTGLTPTSDITISPAGVDILLSGGSGNAYITIKTNGDIEFYGTIRQTSHQLWYFPCLYFIKDFGDSPQ